MFKAIIQKTALLSFTAICILSTAASCSLNPFAGSTKVEGIYGILKQDPSNPNSAGFLPINTLVTANGTKLEDSTDKDGKIVLSGLSVLPIVKITQVDTNVLFAQSRDKGVLYTVDGGASWYKFYIYPVTPAAESASKEEKANYEAQLLKNDTFQVTDFWVNKEDVNTVFIAGNEAGVAKIFRTIDFGDNFKEVYAEVNAGTSIDRILIDPKNSRHVFAILNKNALITTLDGGETWKKLDNYSKEQDDKIVQIDILPVSNIFYILYEKAGYAFSEKGDSWEPVKLKKRDLLKEKEVAANKKQQEEENKSNPGFKLNTDFIKDYLDQQATFDTYKKLIPVPVPSNVEQKPFLLLGDEGLWFTPDIKNAAFAPIDRIPVQEKKINIADVTVNPNKGLNEIYIAIGNRILVSENKGDTWKNKDLGLPGVALGNINQIHIDPSNTQIMYLALGDGQ
jgi:hypothetical protein